MCNERYLKRTCPELSDNRVKDLVQGVRLTRSALKQDQPMREQFWKSLLAAAGLGGNLQKAMPSECIHPIAKGLEAFRRRHSSELATQFSINNQIVPDPNSVQPQIV